MDTYKVTYWIQGADGLWSQKTKIYEAAGKAAHDAVEKQFKREFRKEKTRMVSIKYQ